MIEYLFLDLDDTILDFKMAEYYAIRNTLADFGLEPTEEVCARYSVINQCHWEMLERKEITRDQVRMGRFAVLFGEYDLPVDPAARAHAYESNLAKGHYFMPGAEAALQRLAEKYPLYLTSNGNAHVQKGRLASAGIEKYFQKIFISQEIGVNKPDKEYFTRCFAQIPGFDPEKAMIVGDSLTSDILGGINAGIRTCWVNTRGAAPRADIRPDYEIGGLDQLEALLERIG